MLESLVSFEPGNRGVLELIPCWRMRSKMTLMNTKAQDGPGLWEADARWVSTTSFTTAHINGTL